VLPARGLLAVLVCLAGCLGLGALGTGTAAAAETGALLRVAHLSPNTPAVDVALAPVPRGSDGVAVPGPDIADGLAYGSVGRYRELAPGSYALSIRAADSGPRTQPALSVRVDIPAGGARTVAVSGSFADLELEVLTDDLSAPGAGSARVRVLAAAAGAPTVDVLRTGGPALADELSFPGAGSYRTVPAGPASARVTGGPGRPAEVPLDLPAGSISSLLVLDRPDGEVTLSVVLDAAGPAAVPVGPVPAGSGDSTGLFAFLAALLGTLPLPAPVPAADEAAPLRLQVPSAGIDTALSAVGLDDTGTLVPPDAPGTAGWFADGPAPGEPGPAVIAGHVDGAYGPAVFYRLRNVAVGDAILVERSDGGTPRFIVTRVVRHPKSAFPTGEVYGPTPGAELRLITCGGEFDRSAGSYRDNVVVYARAVGPG
jgi:hypothetical protein